MINRFREWILYVVGADREGTYMKKEYARKGLPPKELKKLKSESEDLVKVKKGEKKYKKREENDDYEIDNILMELDPEIPSPKKYRVLKLQTEEERLLYKFRYLNYNEENLDLLRNSLIKGLSLPDKFEVFQPHLSIKSGRLYFKNLPVLRESEIQTLCREKYFDPKYPFSPDAIYREISNLGANLSRSKVRQAVQKIEHYQLRRELRKPKDVEANFIVTSSNTMAADMFFMGKHKFFNCLECFSGYVKTYHVNKGTSKMI